MLKTTIIYHYDPDSLEFLAEGIAHESPLEAGCEPPVFLVPANATKLAPPYRLDKGYVWCWHHQDWIKTPDHRGQWVHHPDLKKEQEWRKLGVLPQGWAFWTSTKTARTHAADTSTSSF